MASSRPDRWARARRYLAERARLGMKLGLEPMRVLVEALGHPERAYPCLLIAGTNGKGSVAAYVDAALRASGLRVGRYTSPHLVRLNERVAVDGRDITDDALARAVLRVRQAAERLVAQGRLAAHPTFFEATTAAAFEHFRRARVDVAVVEVGLGGRLDATNVCEPAVSAIVTLAKDHEEHLGHTLARIAREKAGVLRRGRATVLGRVPAAARRAVEAACRRGGARLVHAFAGARLGEGEGGLVVRTPRRRYGPLVPLPGEHQKDNVLVAVRLLEEARRAGLPVDLHALPGAISATVWPGRLQWLPGRPPVLLDGAHNPAGARALARHLSSRQPFVLVFGVMSDKHVAGMARELFPLARDVVLTRPAGHRAAPPEEIARRAFPLAGRAFLRPSLSRALALARRLAAPDALVVVAGSLYLVGEVLARRRRAGGRGGGGRGQGRRSGEPGGRRRWMSRRAASSRR